MDEKAARMIYEASIGNEVRLQDIDNVIHEMNDEERSVWAEKLGNVFRALNDEIISPIEKVFPHFIDEYNQN
jgi:hypothetical protein